MKDPSRLGHGHHSLHAFFMAAKEKGHTEFQVQLIANSKGRIEFSITPRRSSHPRALFEVRGNMIRSVAKDAGAPLTTDEPDALIDYGGTRSGLTANK